MFDDQPIKNNNQVPGNLPVGEPEDIFAGTDEKVKVSDSDNQPSKPEAPPAPKAPPPPMKTAVGMGKLQPKAPEVQPGSDVKITHPPLGEDIFAKNPKMRVMPGEANELSKIKGPGLAKNLMIFFIVLVGLSVLGGGSWLIYSLFVKTPATQVPATTTTTDDFENVNQEQPSTDDEGIFINEPVTEEPTVQETTTTDEQAKIDEMVSGEQVLFGEPKDSDSDNLSDDVEKEIGTDPNNWDTDGDGLSDGDEALVWRSNPLNADTDGDGYSDGAEVKNGYSPIGPGKIFDVGTNQ